MTMICAKEFAGWLRHRFSGEDTGVSISRDDINHLTGRQRLDPGFVSDVHYELMQYGMAFVTDTSRENFYLVPVSNTSDWRSRLEYNFEKEMFCNIYPIEKSG
ncbi:MULTISPECIES: hypothetical protein [Vibrio]|jgi:hypothetical protein|uniref:hypothetical protein n=1 Tax=Vibrio TaxID=662 RepID=UPI00023783D3|nr:MULTISPECIES: hypothetical protein [Vibrio]ASI97301.1 hypothetical protein BSZ04_20655 [Vibrio rotiferianus]MDK9776264.1 hypothetical protein [Vibrio sp. D401a]MDK9802319.1 hypothetical protein [Vibrio sp. D406a]NOH69285.1 hypothetical protein [Vibrio rotiferianus]TMX37375.1 hypothetical protein DA095_11775 [Vibrio rotiferianus]